MSPATIHADENEAYPGVRVWHITLDPIRVSVTVSWKAVAPNAIERDDFRQVLLTSETAEVFASVILHEVEDIVGELMRPQVWNSLNRGIIQWYRDNLVALNELKGTYAPPSSSDSANAEPVPVARPSLTSAGVS